MEDFKERVKNAILSGKETTSRWYFNPGYFFSYYFGASSFYGDKTERFYKVRDQSKQERPDFVEGKYKAIGRQLQK
jgi:hypothetical protein